ncbi:MAG: hypothetical protein Q9187_003347 [Circinaria calcarea]
MDDLAEAALEATDFVIEKKFDKIPDRFFRKHGSSRNNSRHDDNGDYDRREESPSPPSSPPSGRPPERGSRRDDYGDDVRGYASPRSSRGYAPPMSPNGYDSPRSHRYVSPQYPTQLVARRDGEDNWDRDRNRAYTDNNRYGSMQGREQGRVRDRDRDWDRDWERDRDREREMDRERDDDYRQGQYYDGERLRERSHRSSRDRPKKPSDLDRIKQNFSTDDRSLGASALGAIAGGIIAKEATRDSPRSPMAVIAGAFIGALGANVLESRHERHPSPLVNCTFMGKHKRQENQARSEPQPNSVSISEKSKPETRQSPMPPVQRIIPRMKSAHLDDR